MITSERENRICDLADELGISYGEAERKLTAVPKPRAPRTPREKKPKEPHYTYNKVIKMAKEAGRECMADNPEMQIEDAAYDLADCLLCDSMIYEAMRKQYYKTPYTNPSRQILKEILADYVASGV